MRREQQQRQLISKPRNRGNETIKRIIEKRSINICIAHNAMIVMMKKGGGEGG
jgi:hypothetical protein